MKQTYLSILLICYLLSAFLWTVQGLITFLYEGGVSPLYLGLSGAELVGVEARGEDEYAVLTTDGQMYLEGLDIRGGLVVLEGEFENYPGELDLYYQRTGQTGYTESQRVFAFPMQDGGYGYRVPLGTISGLRIDTGTEAGNTLNAQRVVILPQRSVLEYFQFSFRRLMVLLILPPLVSCGIYTIMEWYIFAKEQRNKRKRERIHE